MKLRWFGQSCFLLTSNAGTRVLMDPFAKGLGYQVPEVEADIVTTSHDHFDHNYLKAVKGNFEHIDEPGAYTHKDVVLSGTLTCHDKFQGAKRGRNVIYKFTMDGINVCHCGDLGHLLSLEQVEAIGAVDVLLLPVGGRFAITVPEAVEVRKQLNPMVTVPMHYRTRAMGLVGLIFVPLRKFLSIAGGPVRETGELALEAASLRESPGIVVMRYEMPK
jgi:L-ascorbate metabolism protein UlaG (beta-lactamase superfamily)